MGTSRFVKKAGDQVFIRAEGFSADRTRSAALARKTVHATVDMH